MNKKDIAHIRKQFKVDNDSLKIQEIFNVYVKKESGEVYHQISQPFQLLEQQTQELFFANFKKVLAGNLDTKLFELKFKRDVENSTQMILYEGLQTPLEEWKEKMLQVVEKMFTDVAYTFDVVVTFIRAEYRIPTKKRSKESEESDHDEVYANSFILCSVNKTDQPKKALLFDYTEKEFKSNNALDPIINLTSPLTGFLFPAFNNHLADVNHLLYSAVKNNQPDTQFIEEVLNCEEIVTAKEDKDAFEQILKKVIGEKISPDTIANVYEEVNKIIAESEEEEESEIPKLDYKDVERILKVSGVEDVELEEVEHAFKDVLDNEQHELKASSLVPSYTSKSIKINTKVANVAISPKDLKNVKHVYHNGKRCLMIEIDEDVSVEGFQLESEML